MSNHSENELIDAAILSVVSAKWLKVARIIVHSERLLVGQVAGINLNPQIEEVAERDRALIAIQQRIQALVDAGRLEGAGNLSNWRHSEVRLPPHAQ